MGIINTKTGNIYE